MTLLAPIDLTSYMDETGHSEDPKFHFAGMAGFVAPLDTWMSLGKVWTEIFDIFHLKEPFHMKEFAHSVGQFKDWKGKETKRRLLYCALVTTIVKSHAIPIGAIVSLEDFRSLTPAQQSHFKDPYYITFQTCTRGAAIQAMAFPNEKVAMVYAYNQSKGAIKPQETYSVDQAGHAEQLWHAIKDSTDFGPWMGAYASSTPELTVQLQIADLFAYELAKEFENLLTRPNDSMRWGLQQILIGFGSALHFVQLFDRKELLRIIKESNWPDQTGTEEIDDRQMISAHKKMVDWFLKRTGIDLLAIEGDPFA